MARLFSLALCAFILLFTVVVSAEEPGPFQPTPEGWYRGNIHCHSYWSDGNDFPEMVADWYKSHGYHFLGLSDHNRLMRGECWRWKNISAGSVADCKSRFGDDHLTTRQAGDKTEYKLIPLDEIRKLLEEPGRFLMIESQEINHKIYGKQVHMNAINLAEPILPQYGKSVQDGFEANIRVIRKQEKDLDRPILAMLNHPNWPGFDIPPLMVAQIKDLKFLEFCNNNSGTKNLGDAKHPSTELHWDIVNTARLAVLGLPPLWGVASDDSHKYHDFNPVNGNPGQGFIVVRAPKLATGDILTAMRAGDFYASNGLVLDKLDYDAATRTLKIKVAPKPDTKYTIELVGTMRGDVTKENLADTSVDPPVYNEKIGRVLEKVEGTEAEFVIPAGALYGRAVIRADRKMPNPPVNAYDMETAWTQPYGWSLRDSD